MSSKVFKSIDHSSTLFCLLWSVALATGAKRPGTHRRVAKRPNFLRCLFYIMSSCLSTNLYSLQVFLTKLLQTHSQWRWRDLNPRPSPCKGAALPLSYIPRTCCPEFRGGVGLTGFEPVTPALSAQCSNQLSYKPACLHFNN